MRYTIAIDIGGTCTDCAAVDSHGRLFISKTFSTPPDFSSGIVNALEMIARDSGNDLAGLMGQTDLFLHSTSVAENAIVDGSLAKAGLITNRGFEHTLPFTRGGYGRWSGLTEGEKRDPVHTEKPTPLIDPSLIRGIEQRTGSSADDLIEVRSEEIDRAIEELLASGIESLAVCLLWSVLSPDAERRVEERASFLRPDMFVTSSHRIAPVVGEYERTSTTALNARLGPVVRAYLTHLGQKLRDQGFKGKLLVMQAHGGLMPLVEAAGRPVGMIESGPVSGLLGSQQLGSTLGIRNIIATDMGGTTFKVGVIRDGLIDYERSSMVLRYHYSSPKLDVASLGLAGGSVISVEPATGVPSIGPRSAGSFPGPVCYSNGGTEPTVTDVDALLGYLSSDFFLGGEKRLNVDDAEDVFGRKIAASLGMTIEEAAAQIYRLTNSIIGDMLHKATVQRGLDPRPFALVSIGGTAGMHVTSYAAVLGVRKVIVPRTASVHSALGLLGSDIVHEEQATRPVTLPVDAGDVQAIFDPLIIRVKEQLSAEGFAPESTGFSRSIDMRYRRQTNIITVPIDADTDLDQPLMDKVVDRFEELYEERYGKDSGFRDAGIECVAFRVRGSGYVERAKVGVSDRSGTDPSAALIERRRAWVDDRGSFEEIAGYGFDLLRPGNVIRGPAIIWSPITTIVLRGADVAAMDGAANLLIDIDEVHSN